MLTHVMSFKTDLPAKALGLDMHSGWEELATFTAFEGANNYC